MREIKFRGKRIDTGEWAFGDLDQNYVHHIVNGNMTISNGSVVHEINPETIGQYTGLKDKNGKEIYEGMEITGILYSHSLPTKGVITWDNEFHCWGNENDAGITPLCKIHTIQVAGKIHDQVKEEQ